MGARKRLRANQNKEAKKREGFCNSSRLSYISSKNEIGGRLDPRSRCTESFGYA